MIFYGMEAVTDAVFVFAVDGYLQIPLLAADINETDIFTKRMLADSGVMALMFVAMAACLRWRLVPLH